MGLIEKRRVAMDEEKRRVVPSGSPPQSLSDQRESPDGQIPMFSRNLEVNPLAVRPRRNSPLPEENGLPMKPADRNLFFKVEAGKVLEIMRRKISGVNRESVSINLIGDVHQSWRTLWQGDDKFPVGPFTELFDIAFAILSGINRLSRKLDEKEESVLVGLVGVMSELAEDKVGVGYLDSCRLLVEKSQQLAERLRIECGDAVENSTSASSRKPPMSVPGHEKGHDPKMDISSAVDEWFDQVANLMVEPAAKNQQDRQEDTPRPVDSTMVRAEIPFDTVERDSTEEKRAPTASIDLLPESLRETENVPVGDSVCSTESDRAEMIRPAEESEASGAAITGEPDVQKTGAINKPPSSFSDNELNSETVPDVVSAYFRECCIRSATVVNCFLKRLSSASPKRSYRALSDCLEELLRLSENFEMKSLVDDLCAIRGAVGELSRAPKAEVEREKAKVRENLLRLVTKLDKAVISAP
jgi:hypothetical protein